MFERYSMGKKIDLDELKGAIEVVGTTEVAGDEVIAYVATEAVARRIVQVEQAAADGKMVEIIDAAELGTIVGALRIYQREGYGEPSNRPDWLQDIVTDGDEQTSLGDEEIDNLCERLNGGELESYPEVDNFDEEPDEDLHDIRYKCAACGAQWEQISNEIVEAKCPQCETTDVQGIMSKGIDQEWTAGQQDQWFKGS